MDEVMTDVSFIVPTRNSSRTLKKCLESICDQTGGGVECIVVDNHSADDSFEMARLLADKALVGGPERSAQRNLGAREARGEILVFIDSDMVLAPTIASELRQLFQSDEIHAAIIPERVVGTGFWDRCRSLEKQAYLGDSSVEAARAFRRTTFDLVGGYDESLTGPEDWDLPDKIRAKGLGVGRIDSFVDHDESAIGLMDAFMKKRYYGRSFRRFLAKPQARKGRRFLRVSLLRLTPMLLRDPTHTLGLFLLKGVELAGLVLGLVEARWRNDSINNVY